MEWAIPKGDDLDPHLAAENLKWVAYTDPTDANLGDLAQRPDGSLVFVTQSTASPRVFREVTPLEALDWYARNFLPDPLSRAWETLQRTATPAAAERNLPTGSGSSPALVKRPRADGKPGFEWEGDVEVIEAAESLKCVAIDSNGQLPMALYERPDGSLVLLTEERSSGVNRWKDVSLEESLAWLKDWLAPMEVCGRFGQKVTELCRQLAPHFDFHKLENRLNKAAALLELFTGVIDADDGGPNQQIRSGCMTLGWDSAKELAEVLESVCQYHTQVNALVVSDSALNQGWKQLGPILPLDAAA